MVPPEVLSLIFDHLLPSISSSSYPNPNLKTLENSFSLPISTVSDLFAVILTCHTFHRLAISTLWRAPILKYLRSIRLLAQAITQDPSKAQLIRSLHLPASDGLLDVQDTLADQQLYPSSLRIIFDYADRISCLCLGHRPSGRAIYEFLNPSTKARPRTIILSNLSFSAPPFSSLTLSPLEEVTQLHLIKIVPPPALLDFLEKRKLKCLRLSLLPPDALVEFDGYLRWRRESEEYDSLPAQVRARTLAPRAPQGPARRFAVQEALYALANQVKGLEVMLLEMVALEPLSEPETNTINTQGDVTAGQLFTRNHPVALPESELTTRDIYWSQISHGKDSLLGLLPIDIRVVAPRPGGHDRYETMHDFMCQSLCFSFQSTSWDDADIFKLAKTRPELSHRKGRWTGQLPRLLQDDIT